MDLIGLIIASGAGVLDEEYEPVFFPGDDLLAFCRPRGQEPRLNYLRSDRRHDRRIAPRERGRPVYPGDGYNRDTPAVTLPSGARLGPYEVVSTLGAGGMGEVYRARDTRLLRDVAIKIVPPSLAGHPDALARFEREAQTVAALSHPNIVVIHDVGREAGTSFLVMELLEGETLRARVTRGPIPEDAALAMARQITGALAAAHARNVIHRDLKPENLFLTGGSIKILDFGLSTTASDRPAFGSANSPTAWNTEPGTVLGTPGYMSPEQVRGQEADARSDIFTLGAILVEMFTGTRAFAGQSAMEGASAILRDEPDLSGMTARTALTALLRRCLDKNPAKRFQSAHELADAIDALVVAGSARASTPEPPSVAVMPFADLSPRKDQQYFCEGMADEIITALGGLKGLRVASRTSAVRCQEKGLDAAEIGARLNVKHIVEGTVRQSGTKLRITAQLTSASDSYQLWAERYDRELDDVFAVQDEIAKAIAERLKVSLTGGGHEALVRKGTDNPEAYALYLQGRYHWARRDRSRIRMALESFTQALAKDPGYAHAYAGVADCYAIMGAYGTKPGPELEPQAFAAAERALRLDPQLAEAHHAYAAVHLFCRLDVVTSVRHLTRALEVNPLYAISHAYLAIANGTQGRRSEAAQCARRAGELEPDSVVINYVAGGAALWARDVDLAEQLLTRSLELDPDAPFALWALGLAKSARGHHEEAVALAERGCLIGERQPLTLSGLGVILAGAGDRVGATAVLDELLARRAHEYIAPMYVGDVLMGLGRFDEACDWYERAFEERNGFLVKLGTAMEFDPIRGHPRFQALLRRMHLPNGTESVA